MIAVGAGTEMWAVLPVLVLCQNLLSLLVFNKPTIHIFGPSLTICDYLGTINDYLELSFFVDNFGPFETILDKLYHFELFLFNLTYLSTPLV